MARARQPGGREALFRSEYPRRGDRQVMMLGHRLHHSYPSGIIPDMIIGDRLRALREEKKLSQGEIEKRTGLLRCYISRVENGHTVPAVGTLEKMARALEVPLYALFCEGQEPAQPPKLPGRDTANEAAWGSSRKDSRTLAQFRRLLGRVKEGDRGLLLLMAQKMALAKSPRPRRAK
jgi:transcriptional regulator with XRE-family HTH domain